MLVHFRSHLMSLETKRRHKDEWFPVWLYILKKDVEVEEDSGDEIKMLRKEEVRDLNKKNDDLKAQCDDMKAQNDEILRILATLKNK